MIAISEFKGTREMQLILHNGLDNLLGSADYSLINQPWLAFIKVSGILTFYESTLIYIFLSHVDNTLWQVVMLTGAPSLFIKAWKKWEEKRRISLSVCQGFL